MTRLTKQAFILAAALCLATGCGKAKVQEEKADKDQPQQEEIIAEGAGDAVEEEKKVETDAYAEDPDSLGGIPVVSGSVDISECMSIRDMDSVDLEGNFGYEPTYEDARLSILIRTGAVPLGDTDAEIQPGDYIQADIDAYIDGEKDANLSRSKRDIRVGAGSEEKEIEENLVGMRKGEEKEFEKTYGENDNYMNLSGKTVLYRITVNSIARPSEPIETEIMKELERMQESAAPVSEEEACESVWKQLLERTEIYSFPEKAVREARALFEERDLRGERLEDYLNRTGITRAEYKRAEDEYAIEKAKEKTLILYLQDMTGINEQSAAYRNMLMKKEVNPEDPDNVMRMTLIDALREGDTDE